MGMHARGRASERVRARVGKDQEGWGAHLAADWPPVGTKSSVAQTTPIDGTVHCQCRMSRVFVRRLWHTVYSLSWYIVYSLICWWRLAVCLQSVYLLRHALIARHVEWPRIEWCLK